MENPQQSLLIKGLQHCKERLENYKKNRDDNKLLHYLGRLHNLPVQIAHLMQTGVGLTVNNLRQLGGEVGALATNLVAKWKKVVIEECEEESSCSTSAEESASDEADERAEDASKRKKDSHWPDKHNSRDKLSKERIRDEDLAKKRSKNDTTRGGRKENGESSKGRKRERSKSKADSLKSKSYSGPHSSLKRKHSHGDRRTSCKEDIPKKSKKFKRIVRRIYDSSSEEENGKKRPKMEEIRKRKISPQEEKKEKLGEHSDSKRLLKKDAERRHDQRKAESGNASSQDPRKKIESLKSSKSGSSGGLFLQGRK